MIPAMKLPFIGLLAALCVPLTMSAARPSAVAEQQRIERLEMLADLWGKIYLFHPRIVTTNLDWSRVLVETIPVVERAVNTDEVIAVLNDSLFRPLDDPFTRAQRLAVEGSQASPKAIGGRKLSSTVGYIDATDPRGYGPDPAGRIEQLVQEMAPLETIIVDLRLPVPSWANLDWLRIFLGSPQAMGGRVAREHQGWIENNAPHIYRQKWSVEPGTTLQPFTDKRPIRVPVAFIVNRTSYDVVAGLLDVLQSAGTAVVAMEDRGRFVSAFNTHKYPGNIEARLHTLMHRSTSGGLGVDPDYVAAGSIGHAELASLAGKLIAERKVRRRVPRHPFALDMTFPALEPVSAAAISRERRLLGLFKVWTVISYMDPHVQNASIDWANALREWIPRVEAAETLADYYSVLGRLAAKLNDSHVSVMHPSLVAKTILPLQVRLIQSKPIVVGLLPTPSGEPPPVRIGDELVAIGGRRVEDLLSAAEPLISASTPGALRRELPFPLLNGRGEEALEVLLRNETGTRTVSVKNAGYRVRGETWGGPRSSTSYKMIGDNVGYVHLAMLTENEVRPALTALAATHGLILDARVYPRFPIWDALIPHLIETRVQTNRAVIPVRSSPMKSSETAREQFGWIEPDATPRYTKPIVVLVDDRTQSAGEHFCINLKNAKRVTFVGGTTAGVDGDVARISLPGGGSMSFTGSVIKFADGSQFQNIGIVPDVFVEPTIRGIREGRDEVLEKGIEVLRALR